jgi:phage FluMu protein Com
VFGKSRYCNKLLAETFNTIAVKQKSPKGRRSTSEKKKEEAKFVPVTDPRGNWPKWLFPKTMN